MEQESLLLDIESEIILEDATVGQRFLNYLLDIVVFYLFIVLIGVIWGIASPESFTSDGYGAGPLSGLTVNLLGIVALVLFYTLFEGLSKGRTIGKLITGTKVVNLDGTPITFQTALLRSLSRLVPFEPFSALGGNPWHDQWTKTRVVKTRK